MPARCAAVLTQGWKQAALVALQCWRLVALEVPRDLGAIVALEAPRDSGAIVALVGWAGSPWRQKRPQPLPAPPDRRRS